MKNSMWWKKQTAPIRAKAVAYYRHSAQDRQENSIPIQREQVRKFAGENGVEIIEEFADAGKSGLSTEGRDDFKRMLEMVIDASVKFEYVLVFDLSRWGRFQDIDMSAHYRALCKKHGREVIYTSIGFPKVNDPMHFMQLSFEGYRAATYSRELSEKVFRGCAKVAQQGFWAGGSPPYGFHRLLLDQQKKPVQILRPGQRKSIQNQRVRLNPGIKEEQAVIKRIFLELARHKRTPNDIAELLNRDGIPSPGGSQWTGSTVLPILTNEIYIGTMVYNRTASRLQSPTRKNPKELWVRSENAFEGVVDKKLFDQAQAVLQEWDEQRKRKYSKEDMITKLSDLYQTYGIVSSRQIAARKDMVSAHAYARKFHSLDLAFQNMFPEVLQRTKDKIRDHLTTRIGQVEEFDDYWVLNDCFSLLVQPSVPVPHGYGAYWSFRLDPRIEVDVTLGVPLSNNKKYDIMGYLAFPRMLVESRNIRVFSSSESKLDLYGHCDLDLITAVLS